MVFLQINKNVTKIGALNGRKLLLEGKKNRFKKRKYDSMNS